MRIKNFKLFNESLKDEFDKFTDDNLGNKAKYFIEVLPEDKKSEFMYRVTDGEDVLDLMEEFIKKCKLNADNQFEFRLPIFNKKIEDLKNEYDVEGKLSNILRTIEEASHDFEDVIKIMNKERLSVEDNEFVMDQVIGFFEEAIEYLDKSQKLESWLHERENWYPNKNKIDIAKKIIARLRTLD